MILILDCVTSMMYVGRNVTFVSLTGLLPRTINEMGVSKSIVSQPHHTYSVLISCAFISGNVHNQGWFVAGSAFIAAIGFLIMALTFKTSVCNFPLQPNFRQCSINPRMGHQ